MAFISTVRPSQRARRRKNGSCQLFLLLFSFVLVVIALSHPLYCTPWKGKIQEGGVLLARSENDPSLTPLQEAELQSVLLDIRSPYQARREIGIKRLHSLGQTVLPRLFQVLQGGGCRDREVLYRALGKLGKGSHLLLARNGLEDSEWQVRSAAAEAILHIVEKAGGFVDGPMGANLTLLPESEFRGLCRQKIRSHITKLSQMKDFDSSWDRLFWPVLSLGTHALEPLKEILLHSGLKKRMGDNNAAQKIFSVTLSALGRTSDKGAAEAIVLFLNSVNPSKDTEDRIREAGVEALSNLAIHTPQGSLLLQRIINETYSSTVRDFSYWASYILSTRHEDYALWLRKKILEELRSEEERNHNVLELIYLISHWLKIGEAVPFLEKRFEKGEGFLDYFLIDALANLLPPGGMKESIQQKGMTHSIPAVRAYALAWARKEIPSEQVVHDLCTQLEKDAWKFDDLYNYRSQTALEAMILWEGKEAVSKLVSLSKTGKPTLRRKAIRALSSQKGSAALSAIEIRLSDNDQYVRFFAAQALFVRKPEKTLPVLLEFLRLGNFYLERASLELLSTLPEGPGKFPLRGSLSRRMEGIRAYQAWVSGQ